MKDIFGSLHPNRQIARVTIEDAGETFIDMDAGQLTALIMGLARIRSEMADKVPPRPDLEGGIIFRDVSPNPTVIVGKQQLVSKELYLGIRHEGYGWLCFTFAEEPGRRIAVDMAKCIQTMPKIIKPPGIVT